MTLRELIEWFLENVDSGGSHVRVNLLTAVNMAKIVAGDEGDFVVFHNGLYWPLAVWSDDVVSTMAAFRPVPGSSVRIYAYRLDGEDHVMWTPVRAGGNLGNYIEWKEIDGA